METNETNLPTSGISLDTYDRYCRQIDKEDDLINQRINWLLVSQSILFAALGISNRTILDVTLEVALVGIGVSVFIGASVWGALLSLRSYRQKLIESCPPEKDVNCCYPQLHRSRFNMGLGLVAPILIPVLLLVAWIIVIFE